MKTVNQLTLGPMASFEWQKRASKYRLNERGNAALSSLPIAHHSHAKVFPKAIIRTLEDATPSPSFL